MTISIKKNLAYAYRILAKLGMDDHTYTHLSARPHNADYYYINPFGLRFDEVKEDNLLTVTLNGEVIDGEEFQYNKTGYVIHGNIYKKRADISVVFHLHTIATVAVSCMKEGLMPLSQWALHFYNRINYHNYNSLALDDKSDGVNIVKDLSDKKIMFLRNHGIITCASTIHEAMFYAYHLELACKTQISALSAGVELIIPDQKICNQANYDLLNFEKDLGLRDWNAWVRWVEN